METTIAAISTGNAPGGIGIVRISGLSLPSTLPGIDTSPKSLSGSPSSLMRSMSHSFSPALRRFVVVALVYSWTLTPVSL